jgi:hypothetical protein
MGKKVTCPLFSLPFFLFFLKVGLINQAPTLKELKKGGFSK